MGNYTAEDLSKKLKEDGFDVSKRTINYYAYEKNILGKIEKGKNAFTDKEFETIKKIKKLQNHTKLDLDTIKNMVNNMTLDEVISYCYNSLGENKQEMDSSNLLDSINYNSINKNILKDFNMSNMSNMDLNSISNNFSMDIQSNMFTSNFNKNEENLLSARNTTDNTSKKLNQRTVKINEDVTITVSDKIDTEKLIDIINYINKL